MGCFGSVILYNEDDSYCKACPLRAECEVMVQRNRLALEQALNRPVFEAQGKFWAEAAKRTRKRRAMAMEQSSARPKVVVEAVPATAPPAHASTSDDTTKRSPYEAKQLPDLRTKVRERLDIWLAKGIDPSQIEQGVNPFADASGCSVDALISTIFLAHGPLTKPGIMRAMADCQQRSGGKVWTEASLRSNINIVAGAYLACGYQILAGSKE